jgi:hypothetical protein
VCLYCVYGVDPSEAIHSQYCSRGTAAQPNQEHRKPKTAREITYHARPSDPRLANKGAAGKEVDNRVLL